MRDKPRHVLGSGKSSASEHGLHSAFARLECPEKVRLDSMVADKDQPSWAQIGIYVHALYDKYFRGDQREVIGLLDVVKGEHYQTAYGMVYAFTRRYDRHIFGEVVGSEVSVAATAKGVFAACLPLTGRIDLVTRITKAHSIRILGAFDLRLAPGYYIIDHKTGYGKLMPEQREAHMLSPQTWCYARMYEEAYPQRKIIGRLIHYQDKRAPHRSMLYKQVDPSEHYVEHLIAAIARSHRVEGGRKDITQCSKAQRLCYHYHTCWG